MQFADTKTVTATQPEATRRRAKTISSRWTVEAAEMNEGEMK